MIIPSPIFLKSSQWVVLFEEGTGEYEKWLQLRIVWARSGDACDDEFGSMVRDWLNLRDAMKPDCRAVA